MKDNRKLFRITITKSLLILADDEDDARELACQYESQESVFDNMESLLISDESQLTSQEKGNLVWHKDVARYIPSVWDDHRDVEISTEQIFKKK